MNEIKLPSEILVSDTKYPKWVYGKRQKKSDNVVDNFDLWYTERFGWCIPTLLISRAKWVHKNNGIPDRTYGITLDGQVVTMGKGPHVLRIVHVYVTAGRQKKLQKFLDLREKGKADAGQIRDRISTRRAQTSLYRQNLGW